MSASGTSVAGFFARGAGAFPAPASRQQVNSGGDQAEGFHSTDSKRQTWLKEMEKAQMAGWFLPTSAPRGPSNLPNEPLRPQATSKLASAMFTGGTLASQPRAAFFSYPHGSSESQSQGVRGGLPGEGKSQSGRSGRVEADFSTGTENRPATVTQQTGIDHFGKNAESGVFARSAGIQTLLTKGEADQPRPLVTTTNPIDPPVARHTYPVRALEPAALVLNTQKTVLLPALAEPSLRFATSDVHVAGKRTQHGASQAVYGNDRRSSTRVHVEWTQDSLELWLGMDGTAKQVELQAQTVATSVLRTLKQQGQRLTKLTCNGVVVFDATSDITTAPFSPDFFSFVCQDSSAHRRGQLAQNFQIRSFIRR